VRAAPEAAHILGAHAGGHRLRREQRLGRGGRRDALSGSVHGRRPDLVEALLLHDWPFNVRELFKVATQLRVYSPGEAELGSDTASGSQPTPDARRAERAARGLRRQRLGAGTSHRALAAPDRPLARRARPQRSELPALTRAARGS
jgi:DNA-binding NtrC family response regulator